MKTVKVSDTRHKQLKSIAALNDKKLQDLLAEAIDDIIRKYDDADLTIIKDGKIIKEYYYE